MISVIIPVYNVQGYLGKCIESVVNQSYRDLEILLINDGSTDSSGAICDEWANRDSRITVIHQENRGLSAARNVGVSLSSGQYVHFLDSDDYVYEFMYEHMVRMLEETGAQVAICREHSFHNAEDDLEKVWEPEYRVLSKQEVLDKFAEDFQGSITWAWNKLYCRSLIEDISFIEGVYMEDIFFSVDVVKKLEKAVWTDNRYYHYRMRADSIMATRNPCIFLHHAEALRYETDELKGASTEEFFYRLQINNLKKVGGLCIEAYCAKDKAVYEQIRKIYKEIYEQCAKGKVGGRNRLIIFLYRYFMKLVVGVKHILFLPGGQRMKQKVWISICSLVIFSLVAAVYVNLNRIRANENPPSLELEEIEIPLSDGYVKISSGRDDLNIIPDKYNTGVQGAQELTLVAGEGTYQGVFFCTYNTDKLKMDFKYQNKALADTSVVIIENLDFSNFPLVCPNESIGTSKTVIFKNCRFKSFSNARNTQPIQYQFINCEFERFYGSNSSLQWCKFSGGYNDGINPFVNVTIDSCFICDKAGYLKSGSAHTDGLQIYGHEAEVTNNISITNTRFEIPAIPQTGNKAYVNACIFIGLEYNNGMNITIDNCIMNGGGYCIYSNASDPYTLTNVSFSNIRFGQSHRWGNGTSKMNADTIYSNFEYFDSLYVASVWKSSDGNAHLSVTNDTLVERKLRVYTDKGAYDYTIPGCPKYSDIAMDSMTYDDFPFDLDIVVPDDPKYVVCYDITEGYKQIRFTNWSTEEVYIPLLEVEAFEKGESEESDSLVEEEYVKGNIESADADVEEIVLSGSCGRNVEYTLSNDGKLILSGEGATYNYNSSTKSPWYDYKDDITEVYVEEGITKLGAKLFLKCSNLSKVTLPEGVATIGDCAFQSCQSLREIHIPKTLTKIGSYVMSGTILETVYYGGEETDWETIEIGVKNTQLQNAEIVFVNGTVVLEGTCGNSATWKMYSTGKLCISGTGVMYNYNSYNRSEWYDYKDLITEVVIEDGITKIGSQAFSGCQKLSAVTIPDGVTVIGSNAFQSCKALNEITIPKSVISIGSFAFYSSGVDNVKYLGSAEAWSQISMGNKNGLEDAEVACGE